MKFRTMFFLSAVVVLATVLALAQQPASQTPSQTPTPPTQPPQMTDRTGPATTATTTPTTKPAISAAATAPLVPDPLQLQFFRAQSALQEAQSAYQSVIQQLNQTCGEKFVVQLVKGELVCGARAMGAAPVPATTKPAAANAKK